jgi:hypothetical protein
LNWAKARALILLWLVGMQQLTLSLLADDGPQALYVIIAFVGLIIAVAWIVLPFTLVGKCNEMIRELKKILLALASTKPPAIPLANKPPDQK